MAASDTKHGISIRALDDGPPDPTAAGLTLRALMTLREATLEWARMLHGVACCDECVDARSADAGRLPVAAGRSLTATAGLDNVVRRIGDACERLRRYVLPFERLLFGEVVESIEELVVRAQLFVVTTCLGHVREVMHVALLSTCFGDAAPTLFQEFPGGIDEVIRYVELDGHRITSLWTQLRLAAACLPAGLKTAIVPDYWRIHRSAVLAAQRELFGMMDNSRFGRFLVAGIVDPALRPVRADCVRIATALQLRLCAELTLPLPGVEMGWPNGARLRTPQRPVSA